MERCLACEAESVGTVEVLRRQGESEEIVSPTYGVCALLPVRELLIGSHRKTFATEKIQSKPRTQLTALTMASQASQCSMVPTESAAQARQRSTARFPFPAFPAITPAPGVYYSSDLTSEKVTLFSLHHFSAEGRPALAALLIKSSASARRPGFFSSRSP